MKLTAYSYICWLFLRINIVILQTQKISQISTLLKKSQGNDLQINKIQQVSIIDNYRADIIKQTNVAIIIIQTSNIRQESSHLNKVQTNNTGETNITYRHRTEKQYMEK